jgi:hypothetical protein
MDYTITDRLLKIGDNDVTMALSTELLYVNVIGGSPNLVLMYPKESQNVVRKKYKVVYNQGSVTLSDTYNYNYVGHAGDFIVWEVLSPTSEAMF